MYMYVHCSLGSKTVAHWYEATLQLLIYFLQCSAHLHHTPCREWCPGASKLRLQSFLFLQQSSRRRPEPLVPEGVWTFHITFPGGRNWRFLLNKNMLSKALKTTKPRLQQPGWKHILLDSSQWQNIGSSKVVVKAFSRDLFKTFFKCWNLGLRR